MGYAGCLKRTNDKNRMVIKTKINHKLNFLISVRIILFFVFVGLFTVSFQIGATTELSLDESLEILSNFENTIQDIDSVGIFLNNLSIGLPTFVPGLGPVWGLFSGWSTGITISGVWSMSPDMSDAIPLDIFYASPFGFLELIAYSIGMSRGAFLVFSFVKHHPINSILMWTLVEIAIAVALLAVGSIMEISMI